MDIGHSIELKQGQHLVMTPQLQQAIKLLQMSGPDLYEYVKSEVEKNPLLEVEDNTTKTETELAASEGSGYKELENESGLEKNENERYFEEYQPSREQNNDIVDLLPAQTFNQFEKYKSGNVSDFDFSTLLSYRTSLREHLLNQLSCASIPQEMRLIAANLIEYIDEQGYLRIEMQNITERFGISYKLAEDSLKVIQQFDPTGVGARDLEECLKLQLIEQRKMNPKFGIILQNLDFFRSQNATKLAKLCSVSMPELKEMVAVIRKLNPKPGIDFSYEEALSIVPDVYISEGSNGDLIVDLNNDIIPRIHINSDYLKKEDIQKSTETKSYITERQQTANWLVKSIEQRSMTIIRVAAEITRNQKDFFKHGIKGLKPLALKNIAESLNIHPSTVSRAIASKYMSTPRGIFEMKFFFNAAIQGMNGASSISSETVKQKIKKIICQEGKNVLSDDTIVAMLKKEGISIARRTVAKYREVLRIPSSFERKRAVHSPI